MAAVHRGFVVSSSSSAARLLLDRTDDEEPRRPQFGCPPVTTLWFLRDDERSDRLSSSRESALRRSTQRHHTSWSGPAASLPLWLLPPWWVWTRNNKDRGSTSTTPFHPSLSLSSCVTPPCLSTVLLFSCDRRQVARLGLSILRSHSTVQSDASRALPLVRQNGESDDASRE